MKLRLGPAAGALWVCLGAALSITACEGASTEVDVPPVNGIRIDTLNLFGPDSCGTGPNQIAKIAILVEDIGLPAQAQAALEAGAEADAEAADAEAADADAGDASTESPAPTTPPDGTPLSVIQRAGIFDCFADATFVSPIPLTTRHAIRVFGYSSAGYLARAGEINANASTTSDTNEATTRDQALATPALAVASCTAFQYDDVLSLAICRLDRDSRTRGNDTDASDANAADGEAPDADTPDADASDAGDADADADADASDAADAGDGAP